jgi:hypothetical protein
MTWIAFFDSVWTLKGMDLPRVSADKIQEVLVFLTGVDLCEVHSQVLKRHGACYLHPRAWLRPLTHLVLCTCKASSTYLCPQGWELGNEIVSVQYFFQVHFPQEC